MKKKIQKEMKVSYMRKTFQKAREGVVTGCGHIGVMEGFWVVDFGKRKPKKEIIHENYLTPINEKA
ncbi:MAG: hypothetical protein JKY55_12560 [Aliivibrio sp.]|uniref:hypothetical protein n=1 Tax=Aliivibrio sp. TaxID=1872443 RepID=UPI001A5D5C8E|nr:hypothetical protein [Aliivibrio sp.]